MYIVIYKCLSRYYFYYVNRPLYRDISLKNTWSLSKSCAKFCLIIFCPLPCHESYHNERFAAEFHNRVTSLSLVPATQSRRGRALAKTWLHTTSWITQPNIKRNYHFDVIVTNWIAATELLYRKQDGDLLTSFERFRTQSLWPCLTTELPESESYLVFPIIRLGLFNSSTISSLFLFCWPMMPMYIVNIYNNHHCVQVRYMPIKISPDHGLPHWWIDAFLYRRISCNDEYM